MNAYQQTLKGKITLFAKGHFLKGLDTPTLPSDVSSVDITTMHQRAGRIHSAFRVNFKDGTMTPQVVVSFDIRDSQRWMLHGAYCDDIYKSRLSFEQIIGLRAACYE